MNEYEIVLEDRIHSLYLKISDLQQENKQLKEDKKKAREYIKENIDNTGWLEIGSNCVKELLEILGDKENE